MNQLAFMLVFISSVGVAEPELETPCVEALAALTEQHLKIVDVDLVSEGVLYTMAKKGSSRIVDQSKPKPKPRAKVALVGCQLAGNER